MNPVGIRNGTATVCAVVLRAAKAGHWGKCPEKAAQRPIGASQETCSDVSLACGLSMIEPAGLFAMQKNGCGSPCDCRVLFCLKGDYPLNIKEE